LTIERQSHPIARLAVYAHTNPVVMREFRKSLFQDYALQHEGIIKSSSTVNKRWVVPVLPDRMGMCNRITHILSCLAFAMVTKRALLFDWDSAGNRMEWNENIGQSNFLSLFKHPSIAYSHREVEMTHAQTSMHIDSSMDFIDALSGGESLNVKYPQEVLYIHRHDWWAVPLFENRRYQQVLRGMQSRQFFSEGFKFLFTPLQLPQDVECDWLIHIRRIWPRMTATDESFRQCAVQNGFQPSSQPSFLISDEAGHHLPGFTTAVSGCRTGLECQRASVASMWSMSNCKNAVLTHSSTFGQCIVGLGLIQNVHTVHADGTCRRQEYVDPIDAGAVWHGRHPIQSVIKRGWVSEPLAGYEWVDTLLYNQDRPHYANTIVTAYFKIPSKHSYDEYQGWATNMLSMRDAMVIYTSADLVPMVSRLRQHAIRQTIVIVVELADIWAAQNQSSVFWEHQLHVDPERDVHPSHELFWIWNSKIWFVTETIRINPFQSTVFVWSDIGYFRHATYNSKLWLQHAEVIPQTSLLIQAFRAAMPQPSRWVVKGDGHPLFTSGGMMAAHSSTWLQFEKAWRVVWMGYLHHHLFVGEDQALLQSVCLQYPRLCTYNLPSGFFYDWFGLQGLLHTGS
jgi:hypothetical protein